MPQSNSGMSEDAKAILLLCAPLGSSGSPKPLSAREYNKVAHWLKESDLRPSSLFGDHHVSAAAEATGIDAARVDRLLGRGLKLALALEEWERRGIWVLCRSDSDYPIRLKMHLGDQAPPVLYGAGDTSLTQNGGLAIVGSRDVDAEGERWARDVAAGCARGGVQVVSGGARGVDQIAMEAALGAGGLVVCVVPDTLQRHIVSRTVRAGLVDSRLMVLSPYDPGAHFSIGRAMGRNKLIYALADYGLIVSSADRKGGTWAGAYEELKRGNRRPLFVRTSGSAPVGNRKLLELGALPFPDLDSDFLSPERLKRAAAVLGPPPISEEGTLFHQSPVPPPPDALRKANEEARSPSRPLSLGGAPAGKTAFDAVLPLILKMLEHPSSAQELAESLDVSMAQMNAWLRRAVAEKYVRKLTRPTRYVRGEG